MIIIATNIGSSTTILWNGREVSTGIYKYPVETSIYLNAENVDGDHVMDRKVHGGVNKACYMYAMDHYPYWKEKYPKLDWNYGMFGENLTVEGLDERLIKVGNIYTVGTAVVQVSQGRQPCFKLGVRFGTQVILKEFIDAVFPGVYLRVLVSGFVKTGDTFILKEEHKTGPTITDLYRMLFHELPSVDMLKQVLEDDMITENNRKSLLKKYKNILQ